MSSDAHVQSSPRGSKPAVTPIFGLPIGNSDPWETPAPEPVRLHLPQIKIDAVQENADDWRNVGANASTEDILCAVREMEAALQLLAERAIHVTAATGAMIALPRGGVLGRCFVAGVESEKCRGILRATSQLFTESVRTRQVILINDAVNDPGGGDACRELAIGSAAVMPLLRDQQVRGRIEIFSCEPDAFAEADLTTIERIGNAAQVALDLAEAAGIALEILLVDEIAGLVTLPLSTTPPPVATQPDPKTSLATPVLPTPVLPTPISTAGPTTPERDLLEPVSSVAAAEPAVVTSVEEAIAIPSPATATPKPAALATVPIDLALVPVEAPANSAAKVATTSAIVASTAASSQSSQDTAPDITGPVSVADHIMSAEPVPPKPIVSATTQKPATARKPALAGVQNCQGCGFPVSEGRLFCLECQPAEAAEKDSAAANVESLDAMPDFLLPEAEPAASGVAAWLKNPFLMGGAAMVLLVLVVLLLSHFS